MSKNLDSNIFFGQEHFWTLVLIKSTNPMKRVVLSVMLIVALSLASFATRYVATGKTWSVIGDYRIEVAETPVVLNGEELKTFVITYDNSDQKITVAVDKQKKCSNYIVMSDKLSVQYVCNDSYFGVERLDKEYSKLGLTTSEDALNRSEFLHQRVITWETAGSLENTKMIAAYFPSLVKDFESLLAKK